MKLGKEHCTYETKKFHLWKGNFPDMHSNVFFGKSIWNDISRLLTRRYQAGKGSPHRLLGLDKL